MQLQMSVSGMLNELDQMQQDSEGLPRESPVVAVLGECWKDSARNKEYHSQAVSAHRVMYTMASACPMGRDGLSHCAQPTPHAGGAWGVVHGVSPAGSTRNEKELHT